jgi:lysophospholipase L1-like esterase
MKKIFSFVVLLFLAGCTISSTIESSIYNEISSTISESESGSTEILSTNSSTGRPTVSSTSINSTSSSSNLPELTVESFDLYMGFSALKIRPKFGGVEVKNVEVTYSSYDTSLIEIIDGFAYPLKVGNANVTATSGPQHTIFTIRVRSEISYRFYNQVVGVETSHSQRDPINPTLFIGDSFFDVGQFWTTFYSDFSTFNVFSSGISATQSTDLLLYRNRLLYSYAPKNIVIHIGSNDVYDTSPSLDVNEIISRIILMFDIFLNDLPDVKIYFIGIEHRNSGDYARNNKITQVDSYIQYTYAPAHFSRFTYLDTPSIFNNNMALYLRSDNVHPSGAGYAYYTTLLKESVEW